MLVSMDELYAKLATAWPEALRTLREIARGDDQCAEQARRLLRRHEPRPPSPLIEQYAARQRRQTKE